MGFRTSIVSIGSNFLLNMYRNVVNHQFVDVVTFNNVKVYVWHCCFSGLSPCSFFCCGCRKILAGTLF